MQASSVWHWNVFRTGIVPVRHLRRRRHRRAAAPPFDLSEGEQELVGGFHTEYTSIRFALFFLAEFMNTITMSAVIVTLFLGGPDGPGFHFLRWLWPILWFAGKTLVFLYCYVWVRAALPRMRYDQLMDFGWKLLIPLSLAWLLVIAAIQESRPWGVGVLVGCGPPTRSCSAPAVSRQRRVLPAARPTLTDSRRRPARCCCARSPTSPRG